MGLFGRRRKEEPGDSAADRDARIVALARDALARRGREATIAGTGPDARLEGDGIVLPLHTLIAVASAAPPAERPAAVERWIDAVIGGLDRQGDPAAMDEAEVRERIRTRLLPDDDSGPGPRTSGYQRPIGPGLAVVLCLDFPDTVVTLSDDDVARLPLGLDELFARGAENTAREPIGAHHEPSPGTWMIEGDSLFVASKAADLPALQRDVIGEAPYGVVFGVPFRGALLYWVVGADPTPLNALLSITVSLAEGMHGPLPGGPLDSGAWFWRDGEYQRIGGRGEDGELVVVADGAFGRALDEATASTG